MGDLNEIPLFLHLLQLSEQLGMPSKRQVEVFWIPVHRILFSYELDQYFRAEFKPIQFKTMREVDYFLEVYLVICYKIFYINIYLL